jgi:putative Mg2+ transporter-C (MgtC) family protein
MMTDFLEAELLWPILGAVLASAAIGGEREYRSSPAGLRTHVLVGLSCCLLMLAAVHQLEWLRNVPSEVIRIDPVRMAHGILTGIGFLCGGVIFREGFSVRGLTTAASLWTTATLGILFGVGFYRLALFGAVATVLVLAAVTLTERYVPRRQVVHLTVRFTRRAMASARDIEDIVETCGMRSLDISERMDDGVLEFDVTAVGYTDARSERLVAALTGNEEVTGYEIRPQEG